MEKISEMIERMCPEGVFRKKIKDVFTRLKGTPITAGQMKDIEDPNGNVTIFAGGKTIITAFEKDIPNANIITCPSVIVQSRGIIDVQYCESPFTFKNEMWAYTNENVVCVKYLYYFLKQNIEILRKKGSEHGSMPQISLGATEDFEIPFPPISIQQKIVSILDSFIQLQSNLETELASRQKQYEYYRNELLTFDENDESVEWKKIGDIAYISDYVSAGSFASIKENVSYKDHEDYAILLRFADFSNGFDKSKFVYVDEHAYNFLKKSNLNPGDIVISNVGSCGLMFRCPDLGKKMTLAPNSIVFRSNNDAYFYYWLMTEHGQKEIKRITSKSAMPKFNKTQFKELLVPIPCIERQREIVSTLDTFESLITNIKQELHARKKQYEYYREQLLNFF